MAESKQPEGRSSSDNGAIRMMNRKASKNLSGGERRQSRWMREPSESSDSKRPGQQKDVQGVEESKSEPPAQQEKSDRISQAILAARIAERQKSTNIVTEWEPEERNPMSVVMIGSVVTGYELPDA